MYRIFHRSKAQPNAVAILSSTVEYLDKSTALAAASAAAKSSPGTAYLVYEQVVEVKTADPVLVINDKYLTVEAPR